jgi:hypothetical protein
MACATKSKPKPSAKLSPEQIGAIQDAIDDVIHELDDAVYNLVHEQMSEFKSRIEAEFGVAFGMWKFEELFGWSFDPGNTPDEDSLCAAMVTPEEKAEEERQFEMRMRGR